MTVSDYVYNQYYISYLCLSRSWQRRSTIKIKVLERLRVDVVEENLPRPWLTDSVAVAEELEPSEDLLVVGLDLETNLVIADARNNATGDDLIGILGIFQHILVSPLRLFLCRQVVGAQVRHVLCLNNHRLFVGFVTIKIKFVVNLAKNTKKSLGILSK